MYAVGNPVRYTDPRGYISEKQEDALKKILNIPNGLDPEMHALRAPGGNWPTVPIPGYEAWSYYGWKVDSRDFFGESGVNIVSNVITDLENEGLPYKPIVLLYSIRPGTRDAILKDGLIEKLKEKGYTNFLKLDPRKDTKGGVLKFGTP